VLGMVGSAGRGEAEGRSVERLARRDGDRGGGRGRLLEGAEPVDSGPDRRRKGAERGGIAGGAEV